MRPSWDEYFMGVAFMVATRSTCRRRHVGAVLVRDKRILATGYNGAPPGMAHCDDDGSDCLLVNGRCRRTSHAEANCLVQAARHGIPVEGATIYVTDEPCLDCTKLLITAGVRRVMYARPYDDELARLFRSEAGVETVRFAGDIPHVSPAAAFDARYGTG